MASEVHRVLHAVLGFAKAVTVIAFGVCVLRCEMAVAASPELLKAPFDEQAAKSKQKEWATFLKTNLTDRNEIGMDLLLIPPGEFEMGSQDTPDALNKAFPIIEFNSRHPDFMSVVASERPVHRVRITRPFYLGKTNVTVAQFRKFVDDTDFLTEVEIDGMGAHGYRKGESPPFGPGAEFNWRNTGFEQADDFPVVNVSWNDATTFCRWRSKKEGKVYRLITDAEWEYACRAGTTSRFTTGNDSDELIKVANVEDISYFTMLVGHPLEAEGADRAHMMGMMIKGDDKYAFACPVAKFKPNAFGLYDVHGNASTWCSDWYQTDYYAKSPEDDPTGPLAGSTRIVRGGNWQFYPAFCRSSSRFEYKPSRREPFLGFRVVREVKSQ